MGRRVSFANNLADVRLYRKDEDYKSPRRSDSGLPLPPRPPAAKKSEETMEAPPVEEPSEEAPPSQPDRMETVGVASVESLQVQSPPTSKVEQPRQVSLSPPAEVCTGEETVNLTNNITAALPSFSQLADEDEQLDDDAPKEEAEAADAAATDHGNNEPTATIDLPNFASLVEDDETQVPSTSKGRPSIASPDLLAFASPTDDSPLVEKTEDLTNAMQSINFCSMEDASIDMTDAVSGSINKTPESEAKQVASTPIINLTPDNPFVGASLPRTPIGGESAADVRKRRQSMAAEVVAQEPSASKSVDPVLPSPFRGGNLIARTPTTTEKMASRLAENGAPEQPTEDDTEPLVELTGDLGADDDAGPDMGITAMLPSYSELVAQDLAEEVKDAVPENHDDADGTECSEPVGQTEAPPPRNALTAEGTAQASCEPGMSGPLSAGQVEAQKEIGDITSALPSLASLVNEDEELERPQNNSGPKSPTPTQMPVKRSKRKSFGISGDITLGLSNALDELKQETSAFADNDQENRMSVANSEAMDITTKSNITSFDMELTEALAEEPHDFDHLASNNLEAMLDSLQQNGLMEFLAEISDRRIKFNQDNSQARRKSSISKAMPFQTEATDLSSLKA
eukprot:scaffold7868_cov350-Prasinococcus_capsulatus_cf.AAC.1